MIGEKSSCWLREDGEVWYQADFLPPLEAQALLLQLQQELPWAPDEVVIFGKHITTRRTMVWLAEGDLRYTYSGLERKPVPFPPVLQSLKEKLEATLGQTFNSCLANFYPSGSEGMGWHSDNERMLDPSAGIASLSLGEPRLFRFRHKTSGAQVEGRLDSGSLLWMLPPTQAYWKHQLPVQKRVVGPRINLTFRKIRG
jgi:alkylated DNA repair dioxygenase AlkB